MEKYFKELDVSAWSRKTIILDIDGTITADGGSDLDPLVAKKIEEMATANSIFLFSNKHLPDRDNDIANKTHIPLLISSFKKPNKKVIKNLPDQLKTNLLVIGDKILIDGLFAKKIGADFIKVKRLTSQSDSLKVKLIYILDDFAKHFIG
ncbi:MAG: hypothetical protein KGL67_03130 [Patescibacteria group bacterium]|nr:hypothetical protein [Patescibacteria group bacterium]